MKKLALFVILAGALSIPNSGLASPAKMALLRSPDVLNPQLEIFSEVPFTLDQVEGAFLLSVSPGSTHVAYLLDEESLSYDEIVITLASDQPLALTVLPNLETGQYTYELQRELPAGSSFTTLNFSLRHQLFQPGNQMGIALTVEAPARIRISEISFAKKTFWQGIAEPVKQYFEAAPYSGFTVNVFPTPRVFGRSAFVYLVPVFLVLWLTLLFSGKHRKKALVGLLVLWLATDMRMNYEFLQYQIKDHETWVGPAAREKTFRTYGDFYIFADWLKENLPADQQSVNFYASNEHFPRLLQYYLYPVRVIAKSNESDLYVVFHESGTRQELLSEGGEVIANYDDNSFIFRKK